MTNFIHMLVLKGREGTLIQRADAISTIMEVPTKQGRVIFLILANNVKVEVIGETLQSLLAKLHECGGLPVLLHKDGDVIGLERLALEMQVEAEAELEPA